MIIDLGGHYRFGTIANVDPREYNETIKYIINKLDVLNMDSTYAASHGSLHNIYINNILRQICVDGRQTYAKYASNYTSNYWFNLLYEHITQGVFITPAELYLSSLDKGKSGMIGHKINLNLNGLGFYKGKFLHNPDGTISLFIISIVSNPSAYKYACIYFYEFIIPEKELSNYVDYTYNIHIIGTENILSSAKYLHKYITLYVYVDYKDVYGLLNKLYSYLLPIDLKEEKVLNTYNLDIIEYSVGTKPVLCNILSRYNIWNANVYNNVKFKQTVGPFGDTYYADMDYNKYKENTYDLYNNEIIY